MRVDYLSYSEVPSRAANSVHVVKMARWMADAGHQVRLYAWGDPAQDPFDYYGVPGSFEIIRLPRPRRRGGGLALALNTLREVRRRGLPDLFYGRHLASLLGAKAFRRPLIYEAHSTPGSSPLAFAEGVLFRSRRFERLVVISEALRQEYLRRYPMLEGRVVVAHDAADLPEDHDSNGLASWPGRAGALQCGYVGHLYAGRGIDLLMEVARQVPDADFHLVGGSDEDLARWRQQALPPNVVLHGFVPHSALGPYFRRFEVVLAPYEDAPITGAGGVGDTRRWMSPLKLFEYMANGKAIVCSDMPVLHEVLTHEQTALLVPPGDVAAWTDAVRRLAEDSQLRNTLGERAYQTARLHYTWKARARKVLAGLRVAEQIG
jgi:glycosyltransferase involved in cell wall biosynthesis